MKADLGIRDSHMLSDDFSGNRGFLTSEICWRSLTLSAKFKILRNMLVLGPGGSL